MTIIAKTKEKLIAAIHSSNWNGESCHGTSSWCTAAADAILQSPDLRVTLVEPRYSVQLMDGGGVRNPCAIVKCGASSLAEFYDQRAAIDYCNWLNSREPKS